MQRAEWKKRRKCIHFKSELLYAIATRIFGAIVTSFLPRQEVFLFVILEIRRPLKCVHALVLLIKNGV